jgi:hypothetical protein
VARGAAQIGRRLAAVAAVAGLALAAATGPAAGADLDELLVQDVAGFEVDERRSGPVDTADLPASLSEGGGARALVESARGASVRYFTADPAGGQPAGTAVVVLLFELGRAGDADRFSRAYLVGARANAGFASFPVPALAGGSGARFEDGAGNAVQSVVATRPPLAFVVAATSDVADVRPVAVRFARAQAQRLARAADAIDAGSGGGSDRGPLAALAAAVLLAATIAVAVVALRRRREALADLRR